MNTNMRFNMKYPFIILLASLIIGCGNKNDSNDEASEPKEEETSAHSITLSSEQRELANIKTDVVASKQLRETIQLPGKVEFNQQRLAHLTARVAGRVEQVTAFLGDKVHANQVLATIYSQPFLSAQAEFIQTSQRLTQAKPNNDAGEISRGSVLVESSQQKLIVMGASNEDIEEIARTQNPKTFLEIRSPFAGSVVEAGEILGHYVDIGASLFHVADLTNLWVIADAYEKDIAKLKTGLNATIEVTAYPNEKFEGHLTRIFDVLDEKTRTVKVRVEAHNPRLKLKPQMFATVSLSLGTIGNALVIPVKALQIEGEQQLVYIADDNNSYTKRYVTTGRQQDNLVEIIEGLKAGEHIVTDGAFTIKSEFQKSELAEE